ncbi:MAG TPA: DUF4162 domain-containing protein, partial [Aggregatilineales bacterium]|nr:DUF4162 domain-containing protein [Aggregatilineales bacterium]
QEHVRVEVNQPVEARRLLIDSGWPVMLDSEQRLQIMTNKRTDAASVAAQLIGAGLSIYHLSLEQPSLEDIFLKLTGSDEESAHIQVAETPVKESEIIA